VIHGSEGGEGGDSWVRSGTTRRSVGSDQGRKGENACNSEMNFFTPGRELGAVSVFPAQVAIKGKHISTFDGSRQPQVDSHGKATELPSEYSQAVL
jgi:hypothetical protein